LVQDFILVLLHVYLVKNLSANI